MSPRVRPKTSEYARHLEEQQVYKDAARDFARERDEALERVGRRHGLNIAVSERSVYGPGSSRSFFRDMAYVAVAEKRNQDAALNPDIRMRNILADQTPWLSPDPSQNESVEEVRRLLRVASDAARPQLRALRDRLAEQRDVSSGDPGVQALAPVDGVPVHLAESFVTSATASAGFFTGLRVEALPESGQTVEAPYFDGSGSSVATHTEGGAVQEPAANNPDTAVVESPREFIAGQVDASQQSLDFSDPSADVVIAQDLGRKLGEKIDIQLVAGSGTKPQMRGLVNVSGILAVSYTDASPTPQEAISKLWDCYRQLADPSTGFGWLEESDYLIVVHPRRYAWFQAGAASNDPPARVYPGRLVKSAGIRTNLGGGTEDEILVVLSNTNHARANPPRFRVISDYDGSGNLQVRFQSYQEVASAFAPPRSNARLTGTGLINVTL